MRRDISALADNSFDVVVVGGGIYGACIARDAALRGLSTALIEKSDFGSATSHNSLKIVHSGIRYFQHLDFVRVRESINERRFWLSMAPHLVKPIEFIIPTFGHVARGPIALGLANVMHRLIGWDWNRGVPGDMKIGMGEIMGKEEFARRIPGLPSDGISGAATWFDGQLENADRAVLECIQSAAMNGACVANYVECTGLLHSDGIVQGVEATDSLTGRQIEIHARQVINSSGPWAGSFLKKALGKELAVDSIPGFSRNINIVTRKLVDGFGFGVSSKRAGDGVIGDQSRLFFVTPWKNVSVIGTTHFQYDGEAENYKVQESEIDEFLEEINDAYPPAQLLPEDVIYVYGGLTPVEPGEFQGEVIRSRHGDIIDHETAHGISGLISVVGVKYTTARLVAERVVSLACKKQGHNVSSRLSRTSPLPGAQDKQIDPIGDHCEYDVASRDLLRAYGCNATKVLNDRNRPGSSTLMDVFRSCVRYAAKNEMATCLDDVIFRRTDLGPRGLITSELLQAATDEMTDQIGWSADVAQKQFSKVESQLRYAIN